MLVGGTSWSEHGSLLDKEKLTLAEYASVFPIVEVDTFFYAIPKIETVKKWLLETPASFKFILKAYHAMTLHPSPKKFYEQESEMYAAYFAAIEPLVQAGRLQAILFQFSSQFICETETILYLKRLRKIFRQYPVALEFRHASWYEKANFAQMVAFMHEHQFVLVTVDEPQVSGKSVPFVPMVETGSFDFWRLHGRNQVGWTAKSPNWRQLRTLYDYSEKEIQEFARLLDEKSKRQRESIVIFNNNSGGHAAGNARALIQALNIQYKGLNPRNISLF